MRTDDRKARDVVIAEDFNRREDGSVGSDADGRGCHDLMHVDTIRPCLQRKEFYNHSPFWCRRCYALSEMLSGFSDSSTALAKMLCALFSERSGLYVALRCDAGKSRLFPKNVVSLDAFLGR